MDPLLVTAGICLLILVFYKVRQGNFPFIHIIVSVR